MRNGYLHLEENGYYIADNEDLNLAKTIWHSYYDKKTNSLILALSQDGLHGAWVIVSATPLKERYVEAYCNN